MESLEFMQVSASVGKGSVVAGGTIGFEKSNRTADGRENKEAVYRRWRNRSCTMSTDMIDRRSRLGVGSHEL